MWFGSVSKCSSKAKKRRNSRFSCRQLSPNQFMTKVSKQFLNPYSEPFFEPFPFIAEAMTELIVTKLSHCSAPCNGGKEVILLCDRVTKDDIQVRFYQEMNGALVWESYADFGPGDVHKQVAICFRTPRYFNENINQPVSVQLQLRRPSDGCLSDPRGFQLLPKEVDPDGLARKRQKIEEGCLERFLRENAIHLGVSTGPTGQSSNAGIAGQQPIVSPVSPKRPDVVHVPRMTPAIKVWFCLSAFCGQSLRGYVFCGGFGLKIF